MAEENNSTDPSAQQYMDTILRAIDAAVERHVANALARTPTASVTTPSNSASVTGK